jgi:hypothetical protein
MTRFHNVFPGTVQNGVVVLEHGFALPEGIRVEVVVNAPPQPPRDVMTEEERRRINEIMDRIASLPDENPGDTFSGRDHDKVLYGEP